MDETSTPAPDKKKGGWPKGKPRLRKEPISREPLREAVSGPRKYTMKAGANWETNDPGGQDGIDRYNIPKQEIPEGFDLQWVAVTVYGQPLTQERGQFERKGWTPVHQSDFDGRFNGRFMPKEADGEINVGGQVLMARPLELSLKAKARELQAARDQVRIKEQALYGGDLPGVAGSDHPSARRFNSVNRTVERISIPTDD